jgi:carboxyl-terminal processing protease
LPTRVLLRGVCRRAAWAGLALAAAVLAACSGTVPPPAATPTGQLFARGLDEISDLYIEPVSTPQLVLAGAKHLSKLDNRVQAWEGTDIRDRDAINLTYDGQNIASFRVADGSGASGGDVIAQIIEAAKRSSPRVAGLPEDAIDKVVFDGITGSLDKFSRYAPPDLARDQRAARDGFGGIGVTLDTSSEDFRITAFSADGPAAKAGLQIGDKIVAVDGQPTAGRSPPEVIHQLRGPLGSSVRLSIARTGVAGTREYRLERALVVVPTVTASRDGNIAVFHIASFNQSTTQRLSEALNEERRDMGGHIDGIVLDLRGNPGGLLDQAVSLSDLFIPNGPIIATVGRHPASHQYFAATGHSAAPNTPIVVLINGGSASASEIVAAALQDVRRAVVIGSSSYGKGTVQTVLRLPNDGELTLTWARLVTPSGYLLQQHGVVPTMCTSNLGDDDRSLDAALRPLPGTPASSQPRAGLSEPAWSALRSACPARTTSPAIDVKIAERVLADPARYTAALDAIHPAANPARSSQAAVPADAAALTGVGGAISSQSRSPQAP